MYISGYIYSIYICGAEEQYRYLVVGWQLAITGADHVTLIRLCTRLMVHKTNCGRDAPSLCPITEKMNACPAFIVIPL